MSAFMQPALPGYSPWVTGRQDSPFLLTPGVQGLQEGVTQGQGLAFSPQAEFFSGGTEGTAPPSSIPPQGDMWSKFGGSGGAPSSMVPSSQTAQPASPPASMAAAPHPMATAPAAPVMPSMGAGSPGQFSAGPPPVQPPSMAYGSPGAMPGNMSNLVAALQGG